MRIIKNLIARLHGVRVERRGDEYYIHYPLDKGYQDAMVAQYVDRELLIEGVYGPLSHEDAMTWLDILQNQGVRYTYYKRFWMKVIDLFLIRVEKTTVQHEYVVSIPQPSFLQDVDITIVNSPDKLRAYGYYSVRPTAIVERKILLFKAVRHLFLN